MTVTCESTEVLGHESADIKKRVFGVRVAGEEHAFQCAHYQMLTWPDHGAPEETQSIQELIHAVNAVRLASIPAANSAAGACRIAHCVPRTCNLLMFTQQ